MGNQVPDTILRLVERESIVRTISATDGKKTLRPASPTQGDSSGRIDALVYELHGLKEEEVRITKEGKR
jgi:hypothetical protein